MTDCLFCKIQTDKEQIIYENQYFYSIFDAHPVSPGRALLIPKTHTVSLLDLTQNQWAFLQSAIKELIAVIESTNLKEMYPKIMLKKFTEKSIIFCKKALEHKSIGKKPDGYNIGVNEGIAAGRTVHHLHIQIIPRYTGDVRNPIGGIRTIIPELGNYK